MRYLGGKHKSSKYILPIINDFVGGCDYYEPFCGAINIGSGIRGASSLTLSDAHPDLVALLQAAQAGWVPERLVVDEAEYNALKASTDSSARRGLVGFGQSYSGKWFGGYARDTKPKSEDYLGGSWRSLVKKVNKLPPNTSILHKAYLDYKPDSHRNDVFYLDPPYAGTTGYAGTDRFDHEVFWAWAQALAKRNDVLVSEYTIPEHVAHEVLWSADMYGDMRKKDRSPRPEKLVRVCG